MDHVFVKGFGLSATTEVKARDEGIHSSHLNAFLNTYWEALDQAIE
jgi:hypothetical protein